MRSAADRYKRFSPTKSSLTKTPTWVSLLSLCNFYRPARYHAVLFNTLAFQIIPRVFPLRKPRLSPPPHSPFPHLPWSCQLFPSFCSVIFSIPIFFGTYQPLFISCPYCTYHGIPPVSPPPFFLHALPSPPSPRSSLSRQRWLLEKEGKATEAVGCDEERSQEPVRLGI